MGRDGDGGKGRYLHEALVNIERRVRKDKKWTDIRQEYGPRPVTRSQCQDGPRPCPFFSCRHNTSLSVSDQGMLRLHHVDRSGDVDESISNCSLDEAEQGPKERAEVAHMLGLTERAIYQVEKRALAKIEALRKEAALDGRLPRLTECKSSRIPIKGRVDSEKKTEPLRHLVRRARRRRGDPSVAWRPSARKDCSNFGRPCPFVGCRHNLSLDVTERGAITYNTVNHDGAFDDTAESNCALDFADRQGMTLDEVADLFNMTRERVRQLEVDAMAALKQRMTAEAAQRECD